MKRTFVLTDKPPLEVQKQEAREKSVELLSATNDRCYGYYRLSCGHTTFLHYGAVRKAKTAKFKCTVCFDAVLTKEADLAGLVYNKNSAFNNGDTRSYTYKSCGHSKMMAPGNVRNAVGKCVECLENEYRDEAKSQNLELLESSERVDGYRYYKLPCNHIKRICVKAVRLGSWSCRACQEDRYAREAIASGIELIPEIKPAHHDYRVYKLACGCVKALTMPCVKRGSFECKTHDKRTHDLNQPISVYIMKFVLPIGDYVKIGFAADVKGRVIRYGLEGDAKLVDSIRFQQGADAVFYEGYLHRKYAEFSIDKEIMRKYMNNGFTECYPIDLLKTFESEFNSKRVANEHL